MRAQLVAKLDQVSEATTRLEGENGELQMQVATKTTEIEAVTMELTGVGTYVARSETYSVAGLLPADQSADGYRGWAAQEVPAEGACGATGGRQHLRHR